MAALCTAAPVAAAAHHVANFQKPLGQVSLPPSGAPHPSHLRKVVSAGIGGGRFGDGSDHSCDDCQRLALRGLSRKHFVGECVDRRRPSVRRSKRLVTECVIATAVVEEDTEVKVLKQEPASTPALNAKPAVPAQNSSSEELVLKPAPKPIPRPRPQLSPPVAAVESKTATGPRLAPKLNGARRVDDTTFKQIFRPGDKSAKPNAGTDLKSPINSLGQAESKQVFRPGDRTAKPNGGTPGDRTAKPIGGTNPIDSLGQILEKAEKLSEQNATPAKESRYSKSTWRKGDETFQPKPPPPELPQGPTSPNESSQDQRTRTSDGAEASTSASTAPAAAAAPLKLEPPRRPQLAKPPSREVPQLAKPPSRAGPQLEKSPQKQIILKDVGASPKSKDMAKVAAGKPGAPIDPADAGGASSKTGKAALVKGKDGKEDRRKTVADGPKRRIGSKGQEEDVDRPGTNGNARRTGRKMTKASRKAARVEAAKAAAPVKVDILEVGKQGMSVPDLAQKLAVNDAEIVRTLFMKGIVTTVNQTLDEETVKLVCQEFDVEVVEAGSIKVEDMAKKTSEFLDDEDLEHLEVRPPVVTIMGHVDHGKTSLLDYIRKSKVAAGEAGGITQGIGAYRVPVVVDGETQSCVFLDTPGHQAFSAMRARGTRVTDIAIVVVAADDGVRPQTREAIAHAKAANVPIVVAINKIDKDGAEPERVMQELSSLGLLPEDWGGNVPMVQVSALKGQNVDTLLETVMLVAEFQDLKANPNRSAKGTVIESRLDKTKGVMATLLVQNGTLKKGDIVCCGEAYGKVRALLDDTGERADEVGPSTAVQVIGLSNVPIAGDEFEVLDSLEEARERAEQRGEALRLNRLAAQAAEGKVTLSSIANSVAEGQEGGVERHQLNIVLKVDVQGTVEAIRELFEALPQNTVNLRMLMQAAGDITTSDVDLAIASEAIIIGFNVGVQPGIQAYADSKGVEIRLYRVIYELIDDVRNAMEGLLDPVQEQVQIGNAEVRAIFNSGSGKVAGCMVTEGKLVKGCGCKVFRGGTVAFTGTLISLRRVKELAKEVIAGLECGVGVEDFNEWQEGDIIEAFNLVAKKRTLEEASVTTASSHAAVAANAAATSTKAS